MEDLVTLVNQLGQIIKRLDDLNSYADNKLSEIGFIAQELEEIRINLLEYDYAKETGFQNYEKNLKERKK